MKMSKVCHSIAFMLLATVARGNDWPGWRGPEQTGMTREEAVVTSWSPEGENLLWKVPIGGRTTPIVMGDRLYTITPAGEGECLQERVISLDAHTGKTLWEHRFNVFHTDIVENRVGWTAPVGDPETGNIYVHGTGGELFCFDRDGKVKWKWSLEEDFGRYSGYGGRLHTPIIDEDRVIISMVYILAQWGTGPKKSGHRYLAFDKRTGDLLWWAQPGVQPLDTTYSTPVVAVIDGRRMLIAPNADGNVYGLLARTGETVWSFHFSKRGLNTSPVVDGNYVYVTHSEENHDTSEMGRVVCIDGSKTGDITGSGEVWRFDGLGVGYSSPAVANGRLYVATNSGRLHCLDAKNGKELWSHDLGTVMKGSPIVTADGVIYVGEVNGRFHILKDHGDRCESLDFETFKRSDGMIVEIFGSPAFANGRVYYTDRYHTYCLGKADVTPPSVPILPMPKETSVSEGESKLAVLQLIPAEKVLAPGESVKFRVQPFDEHGRALAPFVGEDGSASNDSWTVSGVNGSISSDGTFRAAADVKYSAGTVKLKLAGIEGVARVRVSPQLPIRESFDDMKAGEQPPGWIGVDGKTQLIEKDGNIVFEKMAKSPSAPYGRMNAYSTPPIPARYTVWADMMGTPKEGGRTLTLSDMGLINSRYLLIMLAKEQQLRLVTWTPVPRLQKDVPFEFKPDVWYRAKMSVDTKDGRGIIRGKVWPRDEEEPAQWQIEMTDPCPNLEGSPGLYAYSKGTTPKREGASVFFDNYQVTLNENP